MNLLILTLFMTGLTWARPTVLVSYFDPFGKAPANNSETVAQIIFSKAQGLNLPYDIKICKVQTKFDVSFDELKDCVNEMSEKPVLVLGLGETGCEMKVELMARNLDRTKGPDNAGVERRNTPIVPNAPKAVGLKYPLPDMYCALNAQARKEIGVSNDAGSFVCNNLAYQTTWLEDELNFGFIHVPSHFCKDLKVKNEKVSNSLLSMINRGVEVTLERPSLPRLPVTKPELEALRASSKDDDCLKSFYKQAKAWDEKTRWSIFSGN